MSNSGKRKIMQQHGKKENYGTVSIPGSIDGSFGAKIAALWTGIEHKLSLEINFSPRFARDIIMSIEYCYYGGRMVPGSHSNLLFLFSVVCFCCFCKKRENIFSPALRAGFYLLVLVTSWNLPAIGFLAGPLVLYNFPSKITKKPKRKIKSNP